MIDGYASEAHYVRHLSPIWRALPDAFRGEFRCGSSAALERARADRLAGLHPKTHRDWHNPRRRWVMVASYNDLTRTKPRPAVYVEHGAGQSYEGDPSMVANPWYAGGDGRDHVRLFLCPRQEIADRNLARYPNAAAAVVGCPALDDLYRQRHCVGRHSDTLTVAVSFHAPLKMAGKGSCPEFGWAWPHYRQQLERLVNTTPWVRWLGHGHPRAWRHLYRWWRDIGAEPTPDYEQVIREADVFVCDNSSALYECAALDIPTVVLNSPDYRRHINHGLRFWDYADVGIQVDHPDQLFPAIIRAHHDPPDQAKRRRDIAADVYQTRPLHAAQTAAQAIIAAHDH
jgi:hypothetical protein